MGRGKLSNDQLLEKYIKTFGKNVFKKVSTKNMELYCLVCDIKLNCDQRSKVKQHVETIGHKKKKLDKSSSQVLIQENFSKQQDNNSKFYTISSQICELFLAGNISFNFANNDVFKKFISTHLKLILHHPNT
jgi:uncharacterized UBP type Zn finger protein